MWIKALSLSVSLSALLALTGLAFAQAPPTPATPPAKTATPAPPPDSSNNNNCAPHDTSAPRGTTTGQSQEPLGDKLAKSNGVLCPPSGVDPEIRAPTPEGGNTPVIPPPGSPGGDPTVRPK
jgi:hypothetical protein